MNFSIRLIISCNGCAIGPRLYRGTPMPPYQSSYEDSPEGREMAERDMERIKKYIDDYENKKIKRR